MTKTKKKTKTRAPAGAGSAHITVSMTAEARAAIDALVEKEMPGKRYGRTRLSELVRAAIAEYARSRGAEKTALALEEMA